MRHFASLAVLATLIAGAAQAGDYKAPRTKFGAPDLQGLWTNSSLTFLERPPIMKNLIATDAEEAAMLAGFKSFAGDLTSNAPIPPSNPAPPVVKNAPNSDFLEMDLHLAKVNGQKRTSWIIDPVDGKLPFTPAGKKAAADAAKSKGYDGPEARPLEERCLTAIGHPEGPPMMNTGFNAHYEITQTRDHVAIHIEMNHDVRIIRLNDRRHLPPSVRPWMGDSVGWFEGDTLVVETTNFIPGTGVGSMMGGYVYSKDSKLMERFTRTSKNEVLYEFSVEDPAYFTKVWRAEMPMRAARGPIYEYACHEGNYSIWNALSGARVQEAEAAAAATATAKKVPGAQ